MTKVLSGIRVVEVAAWVFVPAAGALLTDLGADVIKIEPPDTADPIRAWTSKSTERYGGPPVKKNLTMEVGNRGKRSVALNLAAPDGQELLYRLVETADVFLTNSLSSVRAKLRIDVADIRARNPRILYVRGCGYGPRGPDADKAAYDGNTFWARASAAHSLRPPGVEAPLWGTTGFGDLWGALAIAGAIMGGVFHRERTGERPTIDVSLLDVGMWGMSPAITATAMYGIPDMPRIDPSLLGNPIVNQYRTADGRWINLSMMTSDKYFGRFCEVMGVPHMAKDPRFADHASRQANAEQCTDLLRQVFSNLSAAEAVERLEKQDGPWGLNQTPLEVHNDPQALANGYFSDVRDDEGNEYRLVGAPIQYDEQPVGDLRAAPPTASIPTRFWPDWAWTGKRS